jgi:transcriptional regulator with XRE-family HTH domain
MPHDDLRQTLGDAIKARRLELGWTQVELADRVAARGDSTFRQSDVSRLERGNVTLPHRARLERVAMVLGLPLGELLERSGWYGRVTSDPPSPGDLAPARNGEASVQTEVHDGGRYDVRARTEQTFASPQLAEALRQARATRARTEQVLERSEALRVLFQRSMRQENGHESVP